jgi:hypothetical protein
MDILESQPAYADAEHVFLYDNATTHTMRAPDALSARKMPVKPPNLSIAGRKNFLCAVKEANGLERLVTMREGRFIDGSPQNFYRSDGLFKGMRQIIQERRDKGANLPDPSKLKAQCGKSFNCPPGRTDCCCWRVLYCEADFVNQKSLLEEHAAARGFNVLFLPKFHCEINFLEQVWGYSKRIYREFPASTAESDLERNALAALDSVPLFSMRRYVMINPRFRFQGSPYIG